MAIKIKEPIERFNQQYIVDPETGCWNWTGSLGSNGYGQFTINKKTIRAHRFSYEYYVGPLNNELIICHNCDNRKCCNPKHLRQDTISSNSIDMLYVKNHCTQKLSIQEVIEIKKSLKHYYRGQVKDLAHFYKVKLATISNIKRGNTWSHIQIP